MRRGPALDQLFVDVLDVEWILAKVVAPVLDDGRLERPGFPVRGGFTNAVDPFIRVELDEDLVLPRVANDECLDVG